MGGNIFQNSSSIKKEDIKPTIEFFKKDLELAFYNVFEAKFKQGIIFFTLGSTLKKPISNDIDIGFNKTFLDFDIPKEVYPILQDEFQKLKKRARTATDEELLIKAKLKLIAKELNKMGIETPLNKVSYSGFSVLYPIYNSKEYVQIDVMVGNKELLEFSYFSDTYPKGYKGLHRTQLIVSLFKNKGISYSHTKGLIDIETKDKITSNPKVIMSLLNELYDTNISKEIWNYFDLIKVLKEKLNKKELDNVLDIYFDILSKTRVDIPKDLYRDWLRLYKIHKYQTKFLPKDSNLLNVLKLH